MFRIAYPALTRIIALSLLAAGPAQALTIDFGAWRVSLDDPAAVSQVQDTGHGVAFRFAPDWTAGVAATAGQPAADSSWALPGFSITANAGYSLAFSELGLAASGAWSYVPYATGAAGSSVAVGWQATVVDGPVVAGTDWQRSFAGGPESGEWSALRQVDLNGLADTLAFATVPTLTLSAFSACGIPVLSAWSDRDLAVTVDFVVSQVPEPQAWALFGLGLVPLLLARRRRHRAAGRAGQR